MDNEILFTPSAILGLLMEISELQDKEISLIENGDSSIKISIGSSDYIVDTSEAETIQVDDYTLDAVQDANEDGYNILSEDGVEFVDDEPVEGGVVKELFKTLMIGGLVRMSNKYMSKDQFDAYAEEAKKIRKRGY